MLAQVSRGPYWVVLHSKFAIGCRERKHLSSQETGLSLQILYGKRDAVALCAPFLISSSVALFETPSIL